jgi:signal transduction histidine kinase/HAMP domain-containing protein
MFISLNKKILYSLILFIILIISIFFIIFINVYSQNLQDQKYSIYLRNQYVVELLNENINLKKEVLNILKNNPSLEKISTTPLSVTSINKDEKTLSREQKLNAELQKNYDNNREAIITGAKFIAVGLVIVILFILLLIFLLDFWVINPIEKLINISNKISSGIFSSRIVFDKKNKYSDEFNVLFNTFNKMLDNIENNIKAAHERELFLQQLIDAIPDGIRVIDNNYNVIMANKAFYSLLKIKNSCIGKKCYSAYGYKCEGCEQSKYKCPIKELLLNKNKDSLTAIHEVEKKPLYLSAIRLTNDDKKRELIIEALHDLRGDVKFSHQQKVSSLAFLSTSIAHEMKNNLGAIRMIFEAILENYFGNDKKSEQINKYLTMAHSQLVETIKIPERLLKLAQYDDLNKTEIDISASIKDMLLMIDYDAKRKGIEIHTKLEKGLSFVENEADFKMIILNLTQNAIKAMPNGGILTIETQRNAHNIYINIEDTGIGISSEKLKHIFEPFYSANNNAKSSGLGLAIVSSLIEKMKAKISVKSKEGKGTKFTIKIPLRKPNK